MSESVGVVLVEHGEEEVDLSRYLVSGRRVLARGCHDERELSVGRPVRLVNHAVERYVENVVLVLNLLGGCQKLPDDPHSFGWWFL